MKVGDIVVNAYNPEFDYEFSSDFKARVMESIDSKFGKRKDIKICILQGWYRFSPNDKKNGKGHMTSLMPAEVFQMFDPKKKVKPVKITFK